jgi:outer membrane protein assembly factor BamB
MRAAAALPALLLLLAACAERELILPGERFDPRAPLEASVQVEGEPAPVDTTGVTENRSEPVSLPPVTANADYPQRSGNAQHLPPHAALAAQPALVWSAGIGTGNARKLRISAQPVVSGGRVYAMDARAQVTALSSGGGVLWTVDLRREGESSEISGGGLAIGGGTLFATTGYGELVAVDAATGGIRWRQRVGAPIAGSPTVDGSLVYVAGRDSSGWAVRAADGRVEWQLPGTPTNSGTIGAAAPALAGENVIFPFPSGEIGAALREAGTRVWATSVVGERRGRAYAGIDGLTGEPAVAGGTVFVGNQGGRSAAFDAATGLRLWTAREGAYGPMLPAGNAVFLISDAGRLVRLDAATGETVWAVNLPYFTQDKPKRFEDITAHYGPVLAGGRLMVVSGDGAIRLFSPQDGAALGTLELPGGAASPPALAGGTLYVVNRRGQLLAYR